MPRLAIYPLLGPALVLYLIADVASTRAGFTLSDYALAALIFMLSVAGRGLAADGGGSRPERLLSWVGMTCAVALLSLLGGARIQGALLEALEIAALGVLGPVLLEMALCVPDALLAQRYRVVALIAGYALGVLSVCVSLLARGSGFWLFGRFWILPALWEHAALGCSIFAAWLSLGVRLWRRRQSGSQELLSSNAWGGLAVLPTCLCSLALLLPWHTPVWALQLLSGASALALYLGNAQLIHLRVRFTISNTTRDVLALCVSCLVVCAAFAAYPWSLPDQRFARGAFLLGTFLCALALYALLARGFRRVLAPDAGRLLTAIWEIRIALGRVQTLEELVKTTLVHLRHKSGGGTTDKPLLYCFEPQVEGHIDAAGAAHLSSRGPHPLIAARLRERPGDLIVRAELEQQIVRQPAVRPLLEVLTELDLLCVLPLCAEGELEGALLIARGTRRAPLTQEEERALWQLARDLSGLLAVFSAKARAEQRANLASLALTKAQGEIAVLEQAVDRLRADRTLLHGERSRQAEAPTLVAYSEKARELAGFLQAQARLARAVVFVTEPGSAVEPFARVLHDHGRDRARKVAPFVVFDCSGVRAEQADAALFGGTGPLGPEVGCLRAAEGGSLLLLDLPALPVPLQRKLTEALSRGRALTLDESESYAASARIMASTRRSLPLLVAEGALHVELAEQLSPAVCRIPPLHECKEDIPSLLLLAIDQACRRLGRAALGIEPEALAVLREYGFPGNHVELTLMVERAVASAGSKVVRLDLTSFAHNRVLAAQDSVDDPWAATLEEIEKKALLSALDRAHGNKSEAARLLGLPRTTLLDKLRRHKLDSIRAEPRAN